VTREEPDLLWDGAAGAREVLATTRPAMTREAHLAFQRSVVRREIYDGQQGESR
jgi:hypothetical protein